MQPQKSEAVTVFGNSVVIFGNDGCLREEQVNSGLQETSFLISSRNSVGVWPDFFLNTLVKYAFSLKPSSKPISEMVLSELIKRFLASMSFRVSIISETLCCRIFLQIKFRFRDDRNNFSA
jgi:hypothetical protein